MRRAELLAGVLALAAACEKSASAPPAVATGAEIRGPILVLAASSLTSAFEAAKAAFEKAHPGARVELSFAGSPQLVAQIEQGAPADVFASADEPNMKKIVDGGRAAEAPRTFARNRLQIAVEASNPKKIAGLSDLSRPELKVVLCAPTVPAGRYVREAFTRAGIDVKPVSEEPNVKAAIGKIALGEVDAAVVYVTDVTAAKPKVAGVEIPDAQNVVASYPLVVLKHAPNRVGAAAFVEFILSEEGRRLLESFGFRVS